MLVATSFLLSCHEKNSNPLQEEGLSFKVWREATQKTAPLPSGEEGLSARLLTVILAYGSSLVSAFPDYLLSSGL